MASMTTETRGRTAGVIERAVIGVGALVAVAGAAWGSGAFGGTPIEEAADGALAADATLLAPASPAFGIWSVIYTGLVAFAVVQALPGPGSSPRVRAVGWHVLAAMVLNAAWIYVIQEDRLLWSVGVLAAIVVVLSHAVIRLSRSGPSVLEALTVDLPLGLYLGWATVATVANLTAVGVDWFELEPDAGMPAALGALAAATMIGIAIARDLGPSPVLAWATTAALAWGLAWIGYGRLEDRPDDAVVGWAALAAAGLVMLAVVLTTVAAGWRGWRSGSN